MKNISIKKMIVPIVIAASVYISGCNDQETTKKNTKKEVLTVLDIHSKKIEKPDTMADTSISKYKEIEITSPISAESIRSYIQQNGNVELDINGFGKTTFSIGEHEKTVFVDFGDGGMFALDVKTGHPNGIQLGNTFNYHGDYNKIENVMKFVTQSFIEYMKGQN